MTVMNKAELRLYLRGLHEGNDVRNVQSRKICRHVLESPEYKSAQVVGAYMPLSREVDITQVSLDALANGKTLVLPRCGEPPYMALHKVQSLDELVPGAYGILEPPADSPVVPVDELDLLLVPLEGIDPNGFRLGKGGGYYDCLLADADVPTMGCALSWQWVDTVPSESWDKRLCACADHQGIRRFIR